MPFKTPIQPTIARPYLVALLGALNARPAAALLTGAKVLLFNAGPTPITSNSTAGQFTAADFGGYAPEDITFGSPVNLPSLEGVANVASVLFTCDGTTADTVLGYLITDNVDDFVCGEYFDAPVAMVNNGDFIQIDVIFPLAFSVPAQ